MRLYLKLLLMIVVFAGASNSQLQETTSELAYNELVAFTCALRTESETPPLTFFPPVAHAAGRRRTVS